MRPSARERAATALVLGLGIVLMDRLRNDRGPFVGHGATVVGEDKEFFVSPDEHDNLGTSASVDDHDGRSSTTGRHTAWSGRQRFGRLDAAASPDCSWLLARHARRHLQ
jgi:hypothetical protein